MLGIFGIDILGGKEGQGGQGPVDGFSLDNIFRPLRFSSYFCFILSLLHWSVICFAWYIKMGLLAFSVFLLFETSVSVLC